VPAKPLLLLTDPTHFEVSYTINPWMRPYQLPPNCFQEGAGDCIWDVARGRFWAGYGQRSTRQAAVEVSAFFGRETTALEL
jgi:N-dimethylarginine dimethylaminohydrolase